MKSFSYVKRMNPVKSFLTICTLGLTMLHLSACAQAPANTPNASKPVAVAQANIEAVSNPVSDASKTADITVPVKPDTTPSIVPPLPPAIAADEATNALVKAKTTLPTTPAAAPLYEVKDGTKVDAFTYKGFQAWRTGACDRCHGANQEGMVGPSLIASLKTLSKADFVKVVADGRLEKGMVSFKTNKAVMDNMDQLYAYLKGRSDGAITQARVTALPAN